MVSIGNIEKIAGAKRLSKAPEFLSAKEFNAEDVILDLGSLANFKRAMVSTEKIDTYYDDSYRRTGSWTGVNSWADYVELLEEGDEEVISQIKTETKKQVAELSKKYEEVIARYKYDVTGEFFDIGLVLSGVPEVWLEPELVEEEKTQVTIAINVAFSDGTDLDMVRKNASKILAMTKILEDNDVMVALKVTVVSRRSDSTKRDRKTAIITHLKDFDEPINYKKCSALVSPTYLRRASCRLFEVVYDKDMSSGYGAPVTIDGVIDIADTKQVNAFEQKMFKGGK